MIGPFLRIQAPRTVEAVPRLRREVAAWARTTGVNEATIDDLSLVLGELAANAVRHGSGRRVRVVVGRLGTSIDLRVHDDGPGPPTDPPDPDEGHGHGLAIVQALAPGLTLQRGPDGTTAHVRLPIRPHTAAPAGTATLRDVPGP